MVSLEQIMKRVECAAEGDFVICLYNPKSRKRKDYLEKAADLILKFRKPETPVGIVRRAGRENSSWELTALKDLKHAEVDMFTIVIIGNSMTYIRDGKMLTPRGYVCLLYTSFGIAMVQLFRFSNVNASGLNSMLIEMARGLAALVGKGYIVVAPLIGVLGAFISGSATVSTTLFSSLQYETATILALPELLIIAMQVSGGAMGNMTCVNNIVAALSLIHILNFLSLQWNLPSGQPG